MTIFFIQFNLRNLFIMVKKIQKYLLFYLFFSLSFIAVQGQVKQENEQAEYVVAGIQLHTTISYTGFSSSLSFSVQSNSFHLYAGPRLLINDMYLPQKGPWGFQTGINYFFLYSNRLKATAGVDYQSTFVQPYNPLDISTRKMNNTHEVNLYYGIQGRVWDNFWVGSNIGFGRYTEYFHDLVQNSRRYYSGYSGLIKIYFHYEWE